VRGGLGVTLVALLGGACSHGGADARHAPSLASPPGPVSGRVVDRRTGAGLAGRVVIAGGRRATTAADGRFTLPDVPAPYDLAIVDPGGERATVYQKLSRRDPLLVHGTRAPVDEWRARHSARLYGNPTIEGRPPGGTTLMGFFSPPARGLGDPIVLHWIEPATLDGEVLALAIDDAGRGWAARRPLSVTPSMAAATIDLPLAALPGRRVRGAVDAPAGFEASTLVASFRVPIPGAELPILRQEGDGLRGIDRELPDPAALGATLCLTATGDGEGTAGATQCRAGAGGTFALALDRPPAITAPAQGAAFEPDTRFSWTGASGRVNVLQLAGQGPEADRPDVTVYTPDTTVTWAALAATAVRFPRGCSIYQVTAGTRGPYASMDDAVAPEGLGALIPAETRWSQSAPISMTVPRWPRPAPGSFESRLCHYPAGQGVVCRPPVGDHDRGEYYILSAINNKLRNFPELAKSIGIYCVHDCDTARRFMKGLHEYSAQHPGFDAHEPSDTEEC
jgi:hypothetical protein